METIAWSKTRPDARAEARELALLARERLHDAHAADVLLDVGGQLGDALLDLLQRGPRAAPVARATSTTNGTGSSEIAARRRSMANIAAEARTMVSADCIMKISP